MLVPVPHVGEDHADTCGEYHDDQRLSRHDLYSFAYELTVARWVVSTTGASSVVEKGGHEVTDWDESC